MCTQIIDYIFTLYIFNFFLIMILEIIIIIVDLIHVRILNEDLFGPVYMELEDPR